MSCTPTSAIRIVDDEHREKAGALFAFFGLLCHADEPPFSLRGAANNGRGAHTTLL